MIADPSFLAINRKEIYIHKFADVIAYFGKLIYRFLSGKNNGCSRLY